MNHSGTGTTCRYRKHGSKAVGQGQHITSDIRKDLNALQGGLS